MQSKEKPAFMAGDTVTTDFYSAGSRELWQVVKVSPAKKSQTGWWVTARSEKGWMLDADSAWFKPVEYNFSNY